MNSLESPIDPANYVSTKLHGHNLLTCISTDPEPPQIGKLLLPQNWLNSPM